MAIVFESLSLKGLRLTHLQQLRDYIYISQHSNIHYSPRKYWLSREQDLIEWLDSAIKYAKENDVRFPKGDINGRSR